MDKNKYIRKKNGEEKGADKASSIITDPFGSWTGVDIEDINEKPVQDVDDL